MMRATMCLPLLAVLALAGCGERSPVRELSGGRHAELLPMLHDMADDPAWAAELLGRAGAEQRPLTRPLLEALALSEAQAAGRLPGLHVVRDDSPPPGERPPTWTDLRQEGLRLLRAVALEPGTVARDARLARELDEAQEGMDRVTPSRVAGLLVLWQEWWVDRGDDPAFHPEGEAPPTVEPWLARAAATGPGEAVDTVVRLVQDMDREPLRRRMFLEQLDPARHGGLVSGAIELLRWYQDDFAQAGVPIAQWNPEAQRLVGHRAPELREQAMALLRALTPHAASGVDEHVRIVDWLAWWRGARFDPAWYPEGAEPPSLDPWLRVPDGEDDADMAAWLHALYTAEGFRPLLLERLGEEHRVLAGPLVRWLGFTRERAGAAGFALAHERFPLRPPPGGEARGEWFAIPWPQVQAMVRDLLERLTGATPPDLPPAAQDDWWRQWWQAAQGAPGLEPRSAPRRP